MGACIAMVLLGALALILVSAGIEDARVREIANWKNAAIALGAPLWWWASGIALWPDVAIQVGVAALVFAFFVGCFALGMMGGGDVKMIGALALWLPLAPLAWMLVVMSLVGGAVTLLFVVDRWIRRGTGRIEVPYGVAIAIAALLTMREPIINQLA